MLAGSCCPGIEAFGTAVPEVQGLMHHFRSSEKRDVFHRHKKISTPIDLIRINIYYQLKDSLSTIWCPREAGFIVSEG